MRRAGRAAAAGAARLGVATLGAALALAAGCRHLAPGPDVRIGEPGGPYRATLELDPSPPRPGETTRITVRVEDARTSEPVSDLQVVHERRLHSFVVGRDLRHFAHTHQEDFGPLGAEDVAAATFRYPHVFPRPGAYRIVVEFTHRDRTWMKRFDFNVGETGGAAETAALAPRREFAADGLRFRLSVWPDPPRAGRTAKLVCRVETSGGAPVTNLGMLLGSEVHLATWRADGEHFGHAHAWTPEMERMAGMDHGAAADGSLPAMSMTGPAVQHHHGPDVPIRHVFPEPGLYKLFVETAPGGRRTVSEFVVRVAP